MTLPRMTDREFDAWIEDWTLREHGVIEPDQPTAASHYFWMRRIKHEARGEFTADERQEIRRQLGLSPYHVAGGAAR